MKKKIVFLSHTIRDSIYRVGSYYLSKKMAELGHEVLFISSPISIMHITSHMLGKDISYINERLKLRNFIKDEDGIINHVPIQLFPFTNLSIFNSYKVYNSYNLNLSNSERQIKDLDFNAPDLVIQDSLKLNFCRNYFKPKKWIYRATDLYSQMPGSPTDIVIAEKQAIEESDKIFVTSNPLKSYLEKKYNMPVVVLRNGVNFLKFNQTNCKPLEYENLDGDICVYVGSMDDRFDHQLIKKLASKCPNLNIVLIGPVDKYQYNEFNNIICLGEISNDRLPPYLQHASIGLLPFKNIPANHNRSPMKIYEYGASGLPVVSTKLDEIVRRDSKFVYLADNDENFIDQTINALSHREILKLDAIAESKLYSWDSIVHKFLQLTQSV